MNVIAFVKRGLCRSKKISHNWSFAQSRKLHWVLDFFSAYGETGIAGCFLQVLCNQRQVISFS
jgi:hypothetical protein